MCSALRSSDGGFMMVAFLVAMNHPPKRPVGFILLPYDIDQATSATRTVNELPTGFGQHLAIGSAVKPRADANQSGHRDVE